MIRDIFEYIYMYIFASSLNLHYYRRKGNVSLSFGCVMIVFPETSIIQVFFKLFHVFIAFAIRTSPPRNSIKYRG